MVELTQIKVFLAVARELNFLSAARELGMSPSQVSKEIAQLERELKKKLFHRTTRVVRISREGEQLVPVARQLLDAVRSVEEVYRENEEWVAPSGKIRLTCSNTLATRLVARCAAEFREKYPQIELNFVLSDSYLDLIEEELDLAIRIMPLADASLIARKLADNPVVICASRRFLKQHRLRTIADLRKVPSLFLPQHADLIFKKNGKKLRDTVQPASVTGANGDFLVELAKNHAGVLVRSRWAVTRELKEKSLIELDLGDTLVSKTGIYAVYPANRFLWPIPEI
jgi:DNA-binding transcriptional LysR family regulator